MNCESPVFDLPVASDSFARLDDFERGRQKRLLQRFSAHLRRALRNGELLLLATPAVQKSTVLDKIYLGFLLSNHFRYCVLVFSTQRIFVFPTGSDFLPRRSLSAIELGDVEATDLAGILSTRLRVRFRNGSSESFRLVYEGVRSHLERQLPSLLSKTASGHGERVFLCPNCYALIPKDTYACSSCGTHFKTPDEARRRSLLIPGGGYFYTKEYFYGILDAFAESILLLYMFLVIVDALANGLDRKGVSALIGGSLLIAFEKWISVHHAEAAVKNYMVQET